MALQTFFAVAYDSYGFVYDKDEEIHLFADDPDEFEEQYGEGQIGEIVVVTGTAARFRKAGVRDRGPGSYTTTDVWVEWDVDGCDATEIRERWRQAREIARLLQLAHE